MSNEVDIASLIEELKLSVNYDYTEEEKELRQGILHKYKGQPKELKYYDLCLSLLEQGRYKDVIKSLANRPNILGKMDNIEPNLQRALYQEKPDCIQHIKPELVISTEELKSPIVSKELSISEIQGLMKKEND